MKKTLLTLIVALMAISFGNAANAACKVKAVNDPVDGTVFYNLDHRLHSFVELNRANGDEVFCSESEAKRAGYDKAPKYFSNSTARLVSCVENGISKCLKYVIGQARSLEIYDKACSSHANQSEIVSGFLEHAKSSQNRLDVEKFNGTTGALIDAFPCNGSARIARK